LIEVHVASLAGTHAIAAAIATLSRPGDIIVLAGEMGSGKTAFAQGFGRALGITEPITSPTFTLVHSYDTGSIALHHADLYRLDQLSEVADLSLDELAENAVVLVEWGDVAESLFVEHLEVRLETDLDDVEHRDILLSASGSSWAARWERLRGAVTSC
jgi:tRNA threonylcarbamoyladenosine biosynthesis protein TsaE